MSGRDLAVYDNGSDNDGDVVIAETDSDIRSDVELAIADLQAEKAAGAPRGSLTRDGLKNRRYDSHARRTGVPAAFSQASRRDFHKLPAGVRQDIQKLAREADAAQTALADLRPYHDLAQKNGTSLHAALQDYCAVEDALRADFAKGVLYLCGRFAVDPAKVAQAMVAYASAPAQQQNYNPHQNDVATMMQRRDLYPFFRELQAQMIALANAGRATTAHQAYTLAAATHPQAREALQQLERDAESARVSAPRRPAREQPEDGEPFANKWRICNGLDRSHG